MEIGWIIGQRQQVDSHSEEMNNKFPDGEYDECIGQLPSSS